MRIIRELGLIIIAGLLISLAWGNLLWAGTNFTTRAINVEGVPMQFMVSKQANSSPGILVAHGYSGSKQLMLGYAYTLVQNGYGVLLWDLPGHAANTQPFDYDSLQGSFEVALSTLKAQPEVDSGQLAIIGHSMGSGVAMVGGIDHPDDLDAVIAISPTGAPVTPHIPKNLSLQAGEWEMPFVENAKKLLETAGGSNSDLDQGKGRSLFVIPKVEHATILFNDESHQLALSWLNQTFGLTQNKAYRDRRMAWYGLHLLGWLIVLGAVLPRLPRVNAAPLGPIKPLRAWGGLLLSPIAGVLVLKVMNLSGTVANLGGVMIGGALGVWFFIAGLCWLGVIAKLPRPRRNDVLVGLTGFVFLWIGLGAMAQEVWLPWFLTPPRLLLWGLIAIACLPWFLASGIAQNNAKWVSRLGWWLGQSLTIFVGLIVTIVLLPSLGFLAILLPIFPLLFGLFAFLSAKIKSPWGFALASAPIFSWLIMTPFPLL